MINIKLDITHEYGLKDFDLFSNYDVEDVFIKYDYDNGFRFRMDKKFIGEIETLQFWLIPNNQDFYMYTDLPIDDYVSKVMLLSSQRVENELLVSSVDKSEYCPSNAIAKIEIPNKDLNEDKVYNFKFKVLKTFWEYRISNENNSYANFELIDITKEYLFDKKENEDMIIFKSQKKIPCFKRAEDRMLLKFKGKQSYGVDEDMETFLPFANLNSRVLINQKIISITNINL